MGASGAVIVHHIGGKLTLGFVHEFEPQQRVLSVARELGSSAAVEVALGAVKAVYFVRSLEHGADERMGEAAPDPPGDLSTVEFVDGTSIRARKEQLVQGRGYWLRPEHGDANASRIFAPAQGVQSIKPLAGKPVAVKGAIPAAKTSPGTGMSFLGRPPPPEHDASLGAAGAVPAVPTSAPAPAAPGFIAAPAAPTPAPWGAAGAPAAPFGSSPFGNSPLGSKAPGPQRAPGAAPWMEPSAPPAAPAAPPLGTPLPWMQASPASISSGLGMGAGPAAPMPSPPMQAVPQMQVPAAPLHPAPVPPPPGGWPSTAIRQAQAPSTPWPTPPPPPAGAWGWPAPPAPPAQPAPQAWPPGLAPATLQAAPMQPAAAAPAALWPAASPQLPRSPTPSWPAQSDDLELPDDVLASQDLPKRPEAIPVPVPMEGPDLGSLSFVDSAVVERTSFERPDSNQHPTPRSDPLADPGWGLDLSSDLVLGPTSPSSAPATASSRPHVPSAPPAWRSDALAPPIVPSQPLVPLPSRPPIEAQSAPPRPDDSFWPALEPIRPLAEILPPARAPSPGRSPETDHGWSESQAEPRPQVWPQLAQVRPEVPRPLQVEEPISPLAPTPPPRLVPSQQPPAFNPFGAAAPVREVASPWADVTPPVPPPKPLPADPPRAKALTPAEAWARAPAAPAPSPKAQVKEAWSMPDRSKEAREATPPAPSDPGKRKTADLPKPPADSDAALRSLEAMRAKLERPHESPPPANTRGFEPQGARPRPQSPPVLEPAALVEIPEAESRKEIDDELRKYLEGL